MANPNGNPGNKGGGRPSFQDEYLKSKMINKSWEWLNNNFDAMDKKSQQYIALELAKKSVPKDLNLNVRKSISDIINDIDNDR